MASSICWRCRTRDTVLTSSLLFPPASICPRLRFPFTTTAVALNVQRKPVKGSNNPLPKRGAKTTFTVKKKRPLQESRGRTPAPGERKAMRKRVVLSNTNALFVDMPDLKASNFFDSELQGKVVGIPGPIVDRLKAMEAFKPTQSWPLFRRPGTLYRSDTLELSKLFQDMQPRSGRKEAIRTIIVGERGSGKSIHLLQAMAMAFLQDWIVINIPEARDLVNAHTEYGPVAGSIPTIYHHRAYTASLLDRIVNANPRLSEMKVSLSHNLPVPVPSDLSLSRLCALGSSDPALSFAIFNSLMAELSVPSRPPLLLTLDGLQYVMKPSEYMSPAFAPIHAHDFHLIRWFLSHLSGATSLPNGGIVLAATTECRSFDIPTMSMRLQQMEAQQALSSGTLVSQPEDPAMPFLLATSQESSPIPLADPYFPYDQRVLDVLGPASFPPQTPTTQTDTTGNLATRNSIELKRMKGLNKAEARSLMEYWALSGMLKRQVSERLVGEQWALSGGGFVGELERGCVGAAMA